MLVKFLTIFSVVFLAVMVIVFSTQLSSLAAQIGTKDRSSIHNILKKNDPKILNQVSINDFELDVDVVEDSRGRAQGLMHKTSLNRNAGMLFIFPREGIYSFWMKNMNFPIDIIWIDSNLVVVHIEKNVPTCLDLVCPKYVSLDEAQYVLEANAGWAKRANVEVGSTVVFK